MQQGKLGRSDTWGLMRRIVDLIQKQEWSVKFVHTYREANRCADDLALLGSHQVQHVMVYDKVPEEIDKFVINNLKRVSTLRIIFV